MLANGSCHSIEGIKLEELGLKTGEAKLLVRGNLLGAAQDASIILTDFPVAILQPMFRALPALEHAAPAVAASGEPSSCHWSLLWLPQTHILKSLQSLNFSDAARACAFQVLFQMYAAIHSAAVIDASDLQGRVL